MSGSEAKTKGAEEGTRKGWELANVVDLSGAFERAASIKDSTSAN